jgi:transmembrane sensor
MYNHIKAYRAQKGSWDELREQRVFRAIVDQRAVQSGRRRRYGIIVRGAVAAAALTAVVMGIIYHFDKTRPEEKADPIGRIAEAENNATAPVPSDTPKNASILTLASAGQVTLFDGADVSVIEQQSDTVRLEQEEGKALYEINHRDGRLVQVHAAGITITVVGTAFLVAIDDPVVNIGVTRGVVRVDNGKQTVVLEAPETMSVAIPHPQEAVRWRHHAKKKRTARRPAEQEIPQNDDLFSEVDEARRQGNLGRAAELLRKIVAQKKSPLSVASAEFTLGKVERARGRHAAAARAFYRCAQQAPNRSLGEDALAETALSWQASGNTDRAKNIARTYLDRYPKGMYVPKIKRLVD